MKHLGLSSQNITADWMPHSVRKMAKIRQTLHSTRSLEDKSSQNEFPRLLTIVPINIDQNEPMDIKKKIIYR